MFEFRDLQNLTQSQRGTPPGARREGKRKPQQKPAFPSLLSPHGFPLWTLFSLSPFFPPIAGFCFVRTRRLKAAIARAACTARLLLMTIRLPCAIHRNSFRLYTKISDRSRYLLRSLLLYNSRLFNRNDPAECILDLAPLDTCHCIIEHLRDLADLVAVDLHNLVVPLEVTYR